MKTGNKSKVIITFVLFVLISGCKEITTTTTVHKDGSLTRRIEVNDDSSAARVLAYPMPTADGWRREQIEDTLSSEKKSQWRVTKRFNNVRQLREELALQTEKIHLRPEVIKQHRGFYTYYTYRETLACYNRLPLPLSNYLNSDEIYLLTLDGDSSEVSKAAQDEAEAKYERWQSHAVMEVLFQSMKAHVLAMAPAPLSAAQMEEKKDAFFAHFPQALDEFDLDAATALKVAAETFEAPEILTLSEPMDRVWKEIESDLEFMHSVQEDEYFFRAELPGLILTTNADGIEGNKVYWHVHSLLFLADDTVLEASSRTANLWAVVVSGVIAVMALAVLVMPLFRKQRS
jgi:hypothetical protein